MNCTPDLSSAAPTDDSLCSDMQHLPEHMLTSNLHILVCRLHKQEAARGCTGRDGELWVERGMGACKCGIKYRTSAHPEKLLMHELMTSQALLDVSQSDRIATSPSLRVKSFDEWVPEYKANIFWSLE